MLPGLLGALAGCRDDGPGGRVPFDAPAPPEEWPPEGAASDDGSGRRTAGTRGAAGAGADDAPRARLYGADRYPCEGHPVCDEPPPEDRTLETATAAPKRIDPSQLRGGAGMFVARNLFEPLLTYAPGNGDARPGVATSWEVSDDGRTYTFELRDDARWSNEEPVTASDFVYAWTRKLRPETGSPSAENLYPIEGAEAFNAGDLEDADELGLEAVAPHTLRVTLERPMPFWLQHVKTAHYAPIPREVVEEHGDDWTRPEHMVTNGAYRLASWKTRDRIGLERNPHFHARDEVDIPRVTIHLTESFDSDLRRYRAGDLHYLRSGISGEDLARFVEARRPDLFIDAYLATYYYMLNVEEPPLDDRKVRRALSMAIDRRRLVDHVTQGRQEPALGPVPPWFEHTMDYPMPEAGPGFAPERARQLLDEAGYPGGNGLPKLTILYNTSEMHRSIATFVQHSLKRHLGISVAIRNMEWKTLLERTGQGSFQIARYGWVGLRDPYDFLKTFRSGSPNNLMGYEAEPVDRQLERSRSILDDAERMEVLADVERRIRHDTPILPLYHYTRAYLKKPVLRGFEPELTNVHLFRYMYWGEPEGDTP